MRLDKYAAHAAKSRKDIKKLINSGRISVNGTVIKNPAYNVESTDEVYVDGVKFVYREFVYVMMNKPPGVVSATYDPSKETVIDLLSEEVKRFEPFPVGRLDIDTVGMLLITNDGQMAHKLLSPTKKIPKIYEAELDEEVREEDIKKFAEGIVLDDGYKTKPAILNIIGKKRARITISEGKFHQIKRMFADVGKKVLHLKRTEFSGIKLDSSLSEGQWRELSPEELSFLYNIMQ